MLPPIISVQPPKRRIQSYHNWNWKKSTRFEDVLREELVREKLEEQSQKDRVQLVGCFGVGTDVTTGKQK
jgi:hypothetical protein